MTAEQAKEYGIVDEVITSRKLQTELAAAAASRVVESGPAGMGARPPRSRGREREPGWRSSATVTC